MLNSLFLDSVNIAIKSDIVPDAIESFIKSEPLPEWVQRIPFSSILATTGNIILDFKNKILYDKLTLFLLNINELEEAQKLKFEKKYLKDKKTKLAFYKDLFIVLEKLDEEKKAIYTANLFKSLIQEKISPNDFFRFSHIIASLYIEYLEEYFKPFLLSDYNSYIHPRPDLNIIFETHGLVERIVSNEKDSVTTGKLVQKIQTKYKISQFGLHFKKHCLSSK